VYRLPAQTEASHEQEVFVYCSHIFKKLLPCNLFVYPRDAIIAREVSGASTDDTDLAEVSQMIRALDADIRGTMLRLLKVNDSTFHFLVD
jgi:hypothetical protein